MRKRFQTTCRPKLRMTDRAFARCVERQDAAECTAGERKPRPTGRGLRKCGSALGRFDGVHTGIGGARSGLTR